MSVSNCYRLATVCCMLWTPIAIAVSTVRQWLFPPPFFCCQIVCLSINCQIPRDCYQNHRRQSHYFVCLLPHIKLINYEKEGEYPCPGFVTASDMLCYAACYGHRKQFYDCESLEIYRLGDLSVITCVTLRITIYSNKS